MGVNNSWSEAAHSNQNPVEQRGIRILKQDVDGLMTRTGILSESWPWTYSHISDINNCCTSRYLNWRTPI